MDSHVFYPSFPSFDGYRFYLLSWVYCWIGLWPVIHLQLQKVCVASSLELRQPHFPTAPLLVYDEEFLCTNAAEAILWGFFYNCLS